MEYFLRQRMERLRFQKFDGLGSTATLGSADAEALVYNDPGIVYEAQFTAGTHAVSFIGSKYIYQQLQVVQLNGRSKEGVTQLHFGRCYFVCRF